MDNKLKGIMIFYVNLYPDLGQELESTLAMIKEMNRPLIERLTKDGRYVYLLVPTTREATRVDKIDYDSPFPRYLPNSIDIHKNGLGREKPASIFKEGDDLMKGIITLFVNFHPDIKLDPSEVLRMIQKINEDNLAKIANDGQYQIMIVPTTKEASRVEKVDYDMPFPRFLPKASKGVVAPIAPIMPVVEEMEDGPYDEVDDEELEEEGKE